MISFTSLSETGLLEAMSPLCIIEKHRPWLCVLIESGLCLGPSGLIVCTPVGNACTALLSCQDDMR